MDNKITIGDITREYLDGLSIHEIRTLAREVGVPHPTALKKQEMIDSIIDIKDGKLTPQPPRKAGRPPKATTAPEEGVQPAETVEKKPVPEPSTSAPIPSAGRRNYTQRSRIIHHSTEWLQQGDPGEARPKPNPSYAQNPNSDLATFVERTKDQYPEPYDRFQERPSALERYIDQKQREVRMQDKVFVSEFDPEFLQTCEIRSGILEVLPDGYGFLRANNFRNSSKDSYVSTLRIKKCGLRPGDMIKAYCKASTEGKPPAVIAVSEINGVKVEDSFKRPKFDDLVPIFPNQKLRLEIPNVRNELAARAIDLIAPIGKGQRAMVVSPPKAGKTTLLKMIAHSISVNSPEVKLMVLLIDERPEEVTDMQRSIKGEVIYSTFDEESDNHIKVAELVLNRAKRLVEQGEDVVILLDSLTRLARANNVVVPSSGKTLSGGVDPVSLYFPKRFFGAARNIENGGSLTIIATALIDTGSRMDDVVYEEFKGTGNMEIHLDRKLSEKRIFPAIDLNRSGTRREELLLTQKELEGAYLIRKMLSAGDNQEAAESIIGLMQKTPNNDELIKQLNLQVLAMQKDGYRY